MATLWIKAVKHVQNLATYVMRDKELDDPAFGYGCDEKNPTLDFKAAARRWGPNDKVTAYHVRQSWSKQDSAKLTPEEFNQLGRKLIEEKFPGHMFLCATHTETGNIHNHIIVCPWHSETGKKIEDKKRNLYELRAISDRQCKDMGLSVIKGEEKERHANLPEVARKIERDRGSSWLIDLCQKADFARAYSTGYDEYVAILGELGVKARVEEKNISYFYKDDTRGKRGRKLGKVYDKEGLEKAFRGNDKKFAEVAGLREKIGAAVQSLATGETGTHDTQKFLAAMPETTYVKGQRDYSKFTKEARPGRENKYPHERDIARSIIPISEMRQARNTNIPEYCKRHNIALDRTDDGRQVLQGRDFVEINDYDWINRKNNTRGSLIELVAAYRDATFLQAVAEITGNKRLLALEEHFGAVKRPYQSFYIPKEHQLEAAAAREEIKSILEKGGLDPELAEPLQKSGQVQVGNVEGLPESAGESHDQDAAPEDSSKQPVRPEDYGYDLDMPPDLVDGTADMQANYTHDAPILPEPADEDGGQERLMVPDSADSLDPLDEGLENGDLRPSAKELGAHSDLESPSGASPDEEAVPREEGGGKPARNGTPTQVARGVARLQGRSREGTATPDAPSADESSAKARVMRLFAKDDEGGAYEFREGKNRTWKRHKVGQFSKPFFSVSKGSSKAKVFLDPVAFLKSHGKKALSPEHHRYDTICLMEPNTRTLDLFVAQNKRISDIQIFTSPPGKESRAELDFFSTLRARYKTLAINVSLFDSRDLERSQSIEAPSL